MNIIKKAMFASGLISTLFFAMTLESFTVSAVEVETPVETVITEPIETPVDEHPIEEEGDHHGINEELTSEGTDFEFLYEEYLEIKEWDKTSLPKINGVEITEGWFKFENLFYKIENKVITKSEQLFPTNYNSTKGVGNLHIQFHFEESYAEPLGIVIRSTEEGVQANKVLSDFNSYEAYLNYLPAGKYFVALIYDDNYQQKLPTTKTLDYPREFIIEDGRTFVLDIYSKEFYAENNMDEKLQIIEEIETDEEAGLEGESDIITQEQNTKEDEETEKKASSNIIWTVLAIVFLFIFGFGSYKAYKHIK